MWVYLCTQRDLFSWVSREQEDQQGQARDEHAGDEQVEAVVQSPAAHGDCESHIRVRLLTALVVQLITLCWHTWGTSEGVSQMSETPELLNKSIAQLSLLKVLKCAWLKWGSVI